MRFRVIVLSRLEREPAQYIADYACRFALAADPCAGEGGGEALCEGSRAAAISFAEHCQAAGASGQFPRDRVIERGGYGGEDRIDEGAQPLDIALHRD